MCRDHLKKRGIVSHIARQSVESCKKLGKHRWIVEQTHGWLAGFLKLHIRFMRRLDIYRTFTKAGCSNHLRSLRGWAVLGALKVASDAQWDTRSSCPKQSSGIMPNSGTRPEPAIKTKKPAIFYVAGFSTLSTYIW